MGTTVDWPLAEPLRGPLHVLQMWRFHRNESNSELNLGSSEVKLDLQSISCLSCIYPIKFELMQLIYLGKVS